jgi:4-amino-4-deoxy-L-arabinose transferase-like glycosyltransferase
MARTPANRLIWLRRMALVTAVLLYLALALPQLDLPGLHYDEAKEAGLNALEMLQRQDVQAFRSAGVQIGSVFLPLMVQDYIGALNVYLTLPLLAIHGATVPALRLLGVGCGLAALLLVWALGGELARRTHAGTKDAAGWTGEIAALLLAASPTFIFWSRQGAFVTNVVVTLAVAAVWVGLRWQRTGQPGYLYGLAVLAGLGLWSKLLFVWVLGAMAGVAAVAWLASRLRNGRSPLPRPTLRSLLLAGLLFLLALSPLLLFNQQTSGTVQSIFGNLGQSYYGVENTAFLANLSVRLGQIGTLLRSDHLWYLGGIFANAWAPWAMAGLVVLSLILATAGWRSGEDRTSLPVLLWALLFVSLLVVQSSFTVSDLFVTHFAIVQPFVTVLAALAADTTLKAAKLARKTGHGWQSSLATGLVVLVVAALAVGFAADVQTSVRYHQALSRSGGLSTHSDAVSRLAQWLDMRDAQQPLALDWGIDAQVRFLTGHRVRPLEIFGYERLDTPDPGFASRAAQFLEDPTRLYLVRSPEETVFQGRRAALESMAAAQGLTVTRQAVIHDRSGRPIFEVLRIETP